MVVSPRSLHIFQTIPRRSGDEWNKSQKGGETVVLNYCLEAVFASLENVYSKKLYSNFSSLIILNSESLFNLELIGMFLIIMFKSLPFNSCSWIPKSLFNISDNKFSTSFFNYWSIFYLSLLINNFCLASVKTYLWYDSLTITTETI